MLESYTARISEEVKAVKALGPLHLLVVLDVIVAVWVLWRAGGRSGAWAQTPIYSHTIDIVICLLTASHVVSWRADGRSGARAQTPIYSGRRPRMHHQTHVYIIRRSNLHMSVNLMCVTIDEHKYR